MISSSIFGLTLGLYTVSGLLACSTWADWDMISSCYMGFLILTQATVWGYETTIAFYLLFCRNILAKYQEDSRFSGGKC